LSRIGRRIADSGPRAKPAKTTTSYRFLRRAHFYNAPNFGSVIYALAQTSIVNLRDLLQLVFDMNLAEDMTWHLLPLGLDTPIDPIEYISGRASGGRQSNAVKQFLARIAASTHELASQSQDTSRLLTIFKVRLESTKKIADADVVVGIHAAADRAGPLVISKTMDPNQTHPHRMKELIEAVGQLHGVAFGSGIFQAVAWKHGMKSNPIFCWKSTVGQLVRYSNDAVTFIKRLTPGDVSLAQKEYRDRNRRKGTEQPATATLPLSEHQAAS
jgi:hypothetical protein